MVAECRSNKQK